MIAAHDMLPISHRSLHTLGFLSVVSHSDTEAKTAQRAPRHAVCRAADIHAEEKASKAADATTIEPLSRCARRPLKSARSYHLELVIFH